MLAVGVIAYFSWPRSDESLRAALVGSWRAADVSNDALHRRKQGVASEDVTVRDDGTLLYRVALKTDPAPPSPETWNWEVRKGRLLLRFVGAGGTGDAMPPLRFSVGRSTLSIYRSGHPTKTFQRVAAGT